MTETLVVPEAAAGAEARISARQVPDPDALLECLIAVARAHGRTLTREAALAGLPIDTVEGLTPSLFARAAKRAGLACRVVRQPLEAVNELLLPAVLLLKGDKACLLLGWKEDGAARIVLPELGEGEVELSREELNGRYLGHTLYARPEFKFDARTPEVGQIRGRHWFWGTLAENAALYRDV